MASNTSVTANLLTLPKELRDIIYDCVLVSPTKTVTPLSRRELYNIRKSTSGSAPRYLLAVGKVEESRMCELHANISLSLPRTCRQIYIETQALFWNTNTFYFRAPLDLINALKPSGMGQVSSRCITSIQLGAGWILGNFVDTLTKAIEALICQQNTSSLRRLDLVLVYEDLFAMNRLRTALQLGPGSTAFDSHGAKYNDMIHALAVLSSKCTFARGIRNSIIGDPLRHFHKILPAHFLTELEDVLREMHLAWGGQVFCGTVMVWDEERECGLERTKVSKVEAFEQ